MRSSRSSRFQSTLRTGRCTGPAARLAHGGAAIWCSICGRPLRQGEDFGQWRLRVVRPSPRYGFEFRPICPAHYHPDGSSRH